MKIKFISAVALAFFWIATGALLANGRHNGWPNHGISAPGQPNHYASPHGMGHP